MLVIDTDIVGSILPFTLNRSGLYRLRLRPGDNNYCYVNIYHANDDELIYGLTTNLGASASTLVYLEAGNYRYGSSNNMAKFVLCY